MAQRPVETHTVSGALRDEDLEHLERCLELAERGRYTTSPNPPVGAVVVKADTVRGDVVLGEGFHERPGGPHGEIRALDAARDAGHDISGSTVYVSLEPCSHHGRTPPCSDALIEAGVSRVVAIHRDPNPRVAGGGFRHLRQAGVEVAWLSTSGDTPHPLVERAVELNWRFLVQQMTGRPAVTLKWAMSLDGRIATSTGESQWISSPEGRRWALELREEHDAILVGSGTALADDPRLTRRLGLAQRPNLRVVLDRRLRLPAAARLLGEPGEVVVYARAASGEAVDRAGALRRAGAEVAELDEVTPAAVLEDLSRRGVQSLLVEGGAEVLGSFAAADSFDRVAVCCAPLLIGGAASPGPVGGQGFPILGQAPRLGQFTHRLHGPDVVLTGFRESCLLDLYASVAG